MAKKNVTVLKSDTLLNIQVSGEYYNRLYDLLVRLIDRQENPKDTLIKVADLNEPLSLDEAAIKLIMMFVKSIEEEALKAPELHTEVVEIDIKDDPSET